MSGQPAIFSDMCSTCIFRPGNPMHLQPGRLKDVVDANLATGTLLICHTTTYGQAPEKVVCRGFYDRYGARTHVGQIMQRLGGFREVDPDCHCRTEDT